MGRWVLRHFVWLLSGSCLIGADKVAAPADEPLASVPFEQVSSIHETGRLYRELDPEETGLAAFRNDYSSPRIWGMHWRTYLFGAIGTGVATGDVDGDGLPDILAVSKNERSRLYRNLGGFRFEDITEASGIDDGEGSGIDKIETSGGGAAFADVDNDGDLDLYLCYLDAPNQLWINDGSGRFEERGAEWGINIKTASVMGYFADYDRDGDLDLYLATNLLQVGDEYPGPKPDHLFRNEGDRFVEVTESAGIRGEGHAHSAIWWDFDHDGRLDIYVANDFTGLDRLYRNRGDGTFEDVIATTSPRAPYYAMGCDFGDVNQDGLDDFWVADMAPTSRADYKMTLESHSHVYEGMHDQYPLQYMQNVFLLNLNGKRFADIAALTGLHRTDWTWATRLVDLDDDGLLDAFSTNGMLRRFNDGDLGMRLRGQNNIRTYARIFEPSPVLMERNLAFRNRGGLRFEPVNAHWGLGKTGVSFGAAFADLDRDGAVDIILSSFREPPSIYRNTGSGNARILVELRGRESNHFGIGARVHATAGGRTQAKTLVPHRGYMSTDEPVLHFGLGSAEAIKELTVTWPSGRVQRFQDLEVNRRYTISEAGTTAEIQRSDTAKRFRRVRAGLPESAVREDPGAAEFSAQPLLPFEQSRRLGSATAADLNGDGADDLVLGGPSGQGVSVLLGGAGFAFEGAWSLDLEEDFLSAEAGFAVLDADGDGALDLAVASGGATLDAGDPGYQDRLYTGDGGGGFQREFDAALSDETGSTGAIAAGDFDHDGIADLFIGGGSAPGRFPAGERSSLWRGLGDGGFEPVETELSAVGRVTAAAWVDLNRDAYPELVVVREWATPQIWRNGQGVLSLETGALGGEASSGLWASLAWGDFDGDGRTDLAVGNLGLNTGGLWRPASGPRRLWWREDPRGVRLIETHLENGEEWALSWWDVLKQGIPGRFARANSYTEYAERTADELFGERAAQGFALLEIREPRSGVFWQAEDGGFTFEPFPAIGQSGRILSLSARDLDGDGLMDLTASIQPPSLAPWTGRAERGHVVVLLAQRNRSWKAELPSASGLDIGPASPRDLVWGDLNGDGADELVVVLSQGEPVVFELSR